MLFRLPGCLAAALCLALPAPLLAQEQGNLLELKGLQAQLSTINSELKSDLEQVLALQEAIKANARTTLAAQGRSPDMVLVEDAAAGQRRAIQREDAINARLDAILARDAALDVRKQSILARVLELSMAPKAMEEARPARAQ